LRFFLLERAQRGVERGDQLVEGALEVVELADLAPGIAQQVAQGLVFLAHTRANRGQIFGAVVLAVTVAIGRPLAGLVVAFAFAAKKIRQLRHDRTPRTPTLPTETAANGG